MRVEAGYIYRMRCLIAVILCACVLLAPTGKSYGQLIIPPVMPWPDVDVLAPDIPGVTGLAGVSCCIPCMPFCAILCPCDCICVCSLVNQAITVGYDMWLHELFKKVWFGEANPISGSPTLTSGGPGTPGLTSGNYFLSALPSRLAMHQNFITGTIFIGHIFMPVPPTSSGQPINGPWISYGPAPVAGTQCGPGNSTLDGTCDNAPPEGPWGPVGVGLLRPLMSMTEQLTVTMMHQAFIVGTFFDAKHQLETQLLFQDMAATAHKDYRPEIGMCTFGTNVRSLAASDFIANQTAVTMSRRAIGRELGNINVSGAEGGIAADRDDRLEMFARRHCNRFDNNPVAGDAGTGLGLICQAGGPTPETINRDVNYFRRILQTKTLDVHFGDGTLDGEEQDIVAMANNLYSHTVFDQPTRSQLLPEGNQDEYLGLRSVVAKRSVAETSFNALVGLKARGSDDSTETGEYMLRILEDLGIPRNEAIVIMGAHPDDPDNDELRPSYLAQMEILAKKIYQSPEFYSGLYTTPANVKRRSVAMQAIGLMLERDLYDSYLRSEAIMSILLEMKVMKRQEEVQNILFGLQGKTGNP